jgi:hypothetical protein
MGIGLTVYTSDNNENLFSSRPAGNNFNLHALNDDTATESKSVGLDPTQTNNATIWCCPEKQGGLASLNTTTSPYQWQVGYQYLGGVTSWVNTAGTFNSLSPVKVTQAKPGWVLASEDIVNGGTGTGWIEPSHQRPKTAFSDGGNELTVDGSVTWYKIERMYRITTYSTSTRIWYFYQDDLSSIPPATLTTLQFPN